MIKAEKEKQNFVEIFQGGAREGVDCGSEDSLGKAYCCLKSLDFKAQTYKNFKKFDCDVL